MSARRGCIAEVSSLPPKFIIAFLREDCNRNLSKSFCEIKLDIVAAMRHYVLREKNDCSRL